MKTVIGNRSAFLKRGFDLALSFAGLVLFSWLILAAYIVASVETRSNGFFLQKRVGRFGELFTIIKIKTMANRKSEGSTTTTINDSRITRSGMFFRRTKIDELPQLINVFLGDMSFVGPRPDVPGFADKLSLEDSVILMVRPGITGPASLKYRNEEELLAKQKNPEKYNMEVIFPDKVVLNKQYVTDYSFMQDMHYIFLTLVR